MIMFDDIAFEAGKIKGNLERLKRETQREEINRLSCRSSLLEIQSSWEKVKSSFLKAWDSYVQEQPGQDLLSTLLAVLGSTVGRNEIESGLNARISSVTSGIHQADNPQYYEQTTLRRTLGDLIVSTESFLAILDREILRQLPKPLTPYSRLGMLVGSKPEGLDENWLVANSYLSAMEIIVNKTISKLGDDAKLSRADFAEKFKALASGLEARGKPLSSLERQLPASFWRIRNEVVHGGYSPDEKELETAVAWVNRLITALLKAAPPT